MRIHTNTLTRSQIIDAANLAGATIVGLSEHGSRSRNRAFELTLSGSSKRDRNGGRNGAGEGKAATWDEWGIFLANLFDNDVSVTIPRVYANRADFDYKTDNRYDELTRKSQHANHKWDYVGIARSQSCKCGATRRW